MKIKDILINIKTKAVVGNENVSVSSVTLDSRAAKAGSLFFAKKGFVVDGHKFIDAVIDKGAVAIVCNDLPKDLNENVCYIQIDEDDHNIIGQMAANFYLQPSAKMTVVGVTGTNGKTTVATLLFQLFTKLGYKCGLISTVDNHIGDEILPTERTTPDAVSLQHLFFQMCEAGCSHVFMEVSSIAVDQGRIAGTDFDGAIFTNLTHDHLDYHKTFDNYLKAKKKFFDDLKPEAFAITNLDDRRGGVMLQNTKATRKSYALRVPADFDGKVLENNLTGLIMHVDGQDVHFRLSGLFNAYNLLAVYGTAIMLNEDKVTVLSAMSDLRGAPGRFDTYTAPDHKYIAIVDYAHTPDALQNILSTIKQSGQQNHIITVVGCGGDRDHTKRPEMAQVACELSDKAIFTSDNPRSENAETILDEMEQGLTPGEMRKVLRITDRKAAIKTACSLASPNDVIVIAGKGHETYQEINGVKHHFDDREVVQEMMKLYSDQN